MELQCRFGGVRRGMSHEEGAHLPRLAYPSVWTLIEARNRAISRTSFPRLKAVAAQRHSVFTFARPRSKNCRKPMFALMMANGVSAMCAHSFALSMSLLQTAAVLLAGNSIDLVRDRIRSTSCASDPSCCAAGQAIAARESARAVHHVLLGDRPEADSQRRVRKTRRHALPSPA